MILNDFINNYLAELSTLLIVLQDEHVILSENNIHAVMANLDRKRKLLDNINHLKDSIQNQDNNELKSYLDNNPKIKKECLLLFEACKKQNSANGATLMRKLQTLQQFLGVINSPSSPSFIQYNRNGRFV